MSNISLWEDTLKKSPYDLKVLHNLSHFYLEKKDHEKALVTLVKLSRSNASAFYKSFAHSNLGSIHAENKYVSFAENVLIVRQNRNEFVRLLTLVLESNDRGIKELEVGNYMAKKRAQWLLGRTEDLFY